MYDVLEVLSNAQAITLIGATVSTNVFDFQTTKDIAVGTPQWFQARVNTTFASGGAGTLAVTVETSDDNSTYRTLATSKTFALSELKQGANLLLVALPVGVSRYLRVTYTVATAAMTAGKVDAMLIESPQLDRYFALGFA